MFPLGLLMRGPFVKRQQTKKGTTFPRDCLMTSGKALGMLDLKLSVVSMWMAIRFCGDWCFLFRGYDKRLLAGPYHNFNMSEENVLSISAFKDIVGILRNRHSDKVESAAALADYVDAIADDCDELVLNWLNMTEDIRSSNQRFMYSQMREFRGNVASVSALKVAYDRLHFALSRKRRLADELHALVAATLYNRELLFHLVRSDPNPPRNEINKLLDALASNAAEIRHLGREVRLRVK